MVGAKHPQQSKARHHITKIRVLSKKRQVFLRRVLKHTTILR